MTSITTPAAGSTTSKPTNLTPYQGPATTDASAATGTSDTFTTAPEPTVPSSAPTATAPTTTGKHKRSGLKWADTDKTLPGYKRVLQFIKGNIPHIGKQQTTSV